MKQYSQPILVLPRDGIGFFFNGHSNEQSHPINHLCDGGLSWVMFNYLMNYDFLHFSLLFFLQVLYRLEKVEWRSMRSMTKVLGTLICVAGAIAMAFFKGPRLLAMEIYHMMLQSASNKWIIGSLFLFGSNICWSGWLIMQVFKFSSIYRYIILLTR